MKVARYQSAAGPERLGIVTSSAGLEMLVKGVSLRFEGDTVIAERQWRQQFPRDLA